MLIYTPQQTTVDALVDYIDKILCLERYLDSECVENACFLKQIVLALVKNCQLHSLLTIFGHSASCTSPNYTKFCGMFRLIRSHIEKVTTEPHQHICAIMHVYGQLLRMHVDTCVSDACGMNSCKDIKKMREEQGLKILPNTFAQKELALKDAIAVPDIVSRIEDLIL